MFELNLLCPEARVDVLSEALEALEALSVSVEDADAETENEKALFGEPGMPPPKEGWQRSKMVALFAKEGAEPTTLSPQQTADYVKQEVERWKQVARTGRIQVN